MNTKAFPQEIGFDTSALPPHFIEQTVHSLVDFCADAEISKESDEPTKAGAFSSFFAKRQLIDALHEVAKTPIGRAAIRAFYYNGQQLKKQDPDFKYYLSTKANCPNLGLCHLDSGIIEINEQNINSHLEKAKNDLISQGISPSKTTQKQAKLFLHGTTFLHESMHINQAKAGVSASYDPWIMDHLSIFLDATPQAISRELFTESNNPLLHKAFKISPSEIATFHQAEANTTATSKNINFSTHLTQKIQDKTREFLKPIDQTSNDYSTLKTRWNYLKQNLYLFSYEREKNTTHRATFADYLKTSTGIQLKFTPLLPQKLKKQIERSAQKIQKHYSKTDVQALQSFVQGKIPFPEHLFQDTKNPAYKEVQSLKTLITNLDTSFEELSNLSPKINQGDTKAIQKSTQILRDLNAKCGISLPPQNLGTTPSANAPVPQRTLNKNAQNITNEKTHKNAHPKQEREIL